MIKYNEIKSLDDITGCLVKIWELSNPEEMQYEIENLIFDLNNLRKINFELIRKK